MRPERTIRGVPAFLLRLRLKARLQGNVWNVWAEREFPENYVSPEMASRDAQATARHRAAFQAAREQAREQARATPDQIDAILRRHLG